MSRSTRAAVVIALAAVLAVAATYVGTGPLGFFWDDYLLLRPRPWSELLRVWHGSWDITGYGPVFYRPLAVWADTAAFSLFGFNGTWLRLAALAQLTVGAALVGQFARREGAGVWFGALAATLYAVHPAVSASAGPWWFEQNHRLAVICAVAALLTWQSRRSTLSWRAWWPVHAWILAGSLFKEDVLVLAPVLLFFQWWRARVLGDVPSPSLAFITRISSGWAAWFVARWWLLGAIAGAPIGGPDGTRADAARHALRGLWRVFIEVRAMQGESLVPHQIATLLLIAVSLAGLTAWWLGASPRARLLMGHGLALGLGANVLVAIASFPTRYHLMAIGGVLMLCGALLAWHDRNAGPRRAAVAILAVALAVSFSTASRASVWLYRPCTPANLHLDTQLRVWLDGIPFWRESWVLPWLDEKAQRCADGRTVVPTDAIPDVLADVRAGRRR